MFMVSSRCGKNPLRQIFMVKMFPDVRHVLQCNDSVKDRIHLQTRYKLEKLLKTPSQNTKRLFLVRITLSVWRA